MRRRCIFFNLLFGSRQTLAQNLSLILTAICVSGVLLLSFAPVTFFFLITTREYTFFKLLNVAFFTIAGGLGLLFLRAGMVATADPHNMQGIGMRRLIFFRWILLYAFVGSHMAWTLSPYMGDPHISFLFLQQPDGNLYSDVLNSIRQLLRY